MGDEYIDIKDLSITIPSKAKDVDLITFKSIMAQVELYSNELKSNMNLSHSLFVDHVENDKIHKDSGEVCRIWR